MLVDVIEALCRVIEECLAAIRDEAKKSELAALYAAAMGEKDIQEG